jgi:hypothetical protein
VEYDVFTFAALEEVSAYGETSKVEEVSKGLGVGDGGVGVLALAGVLSSRLRIQAADELAIRGVTDADIEEPRLFGCQGLVRVTDCEPETAVVVDFEGNVAADSVAGDGRADDLLRGDTVVTAAGHDLLPARRCGGGSDTLVFVLLKLWQTIELSVI